MPLNPFQLQIEMDGSEPIENLVSGIPHWSTHGFFIERRHAI
jgi:hypothetical protein